MIKRRAIIAGLAAALLPSIARAGDEGKKRDVANPNAVAQILDLMKKDQDAQMFRAVCVARFDTTAGGFTVQIRRIGEALPDEARYRYIGPSPSVGDDVIVFRVGGGYYVAGVDETTLDRQGQGAVISNTSAETAVWSVLVPGGTLGLVNGLNFFFALSFFSLGAETVTVRLKADGVTVLNIVTAFPMSALGTGSYIVQNELVQNRGSLTSQLIVNPSGGSFTGPITATSLDTSQDILWEVTVQMSAASPTTTSRLESATLERV